jgi:hypothetical protein
MRRESGRIIEDDAFWLLKRFGFARHARRGDRQGNPDL